MKRARRPPRTLSLLLPRNSNPSAVSPKPGDPETEKYMTHQNDGETADSSHLSRLKHPSPGSTVRMRARSSFTLLVHPQHHLQSDGHVSFGISAPLRTRIRSPPSPLTAALHKQLLPRRPLVIRDLWFIDEVYKMAAFPVHHAAAHAASLQERRPANNILSTSTLKICMLATGHNSTTT